MKNNTKTIAKDNKIQRRIPLVFHFGTCALFLLFGCGDTTHDAEEPLAVHTQNFADVDTHAQPVLSDNDEEEIVQERVEEAVVQDAVHSYVDVLTSSLDTTDDEIAHMSNVIRLIYSDLQFNDKLRESWRFLSNSSHYCNVTNIAHHLAVVASTLDEKHFAMHLLTQGSLRFEQYADGLEKNYTIIREQLEQEIPPSGIIIGAYQNLSMLYTIMGSREESVTAAREAIAWWDSIEVTTSRAGVESTLAEALARAGYFEEAEEIFMHMIETHDHINEQTCEPWLSIIRLYKRDPELWDSEKDIVPINYQF